MLAEDWAKNCGIRSPLEGGTCVIISWTGGCTKVTTDVLGDGCLLGGSMIRLMDWNF